MSGDCLFSGDNPDTEEHVIPKWLQRRFNLFNEKLQIPNATTLQYKYLKVPVCIMHNNAFSKIENNIANGIFKLDEVYLWALKIHIGLIYRHSSLKFDRSIIESPTILDVNDFATEVWLFRQLYDIWRHEGNTSPSPVGSVFIVDSLMERPQFDFIHCLTSGTIGISIGDKFILVFLWDQGDGYNTNILSIWENYHSKLPSQLNSGSKRNDITYIAYHVWACESAYWLYRHRRSFNVMRSKNNLTLIPPLMRQQGQAERKEEYMEFCRTFGLQLEQYNGGTNNKYSSLFAKG